MLLPSRGLSCGCRTTSADMSHAPHALQTQGAANYRRYRVQLQPRHRGGAFSCKELEQLPAHKQDTYTCYNKPSPLPPPPHELRILARLRRPRDGPLFCRRCLAAITPGILYCVVCSARCCKRRLQKRRRRPHGQSARCVTVHLSSHELKLLISDPEVCPPSPPRLQPPTHDRVAAIGTAVRASALLDDGGFTAITC